MLDVRVRKRLAAFELDVEIAVDHGILVLFGPSGAGKSMLLRVIAGVERVDAGTIRLGERTLLDTEAGINLDARRRSVGYVPQDYALFPHLSAIDNVAYPMVAGRGMRRGAAHARARELLAVVGLAERGDARPFELSGGQQQRVALARAVAADPEVLLLDEPLAALDTPTRLELREVLQVIQRNLTVRVVFVTHDLEEAVTIGSSMAVMVDGKVRQLDRVGRVLDEPRDRLVADLVQSRNIVPGIVARDGDRMMVDTPVGRLLSHDRRPDGRVDVVIRPDLIRLLDGGEVDVGPGTRLDGIVVDVVDYGTRASVIVRVGGGRLEVAVVRGDLALRQIQPGVALTLFVPARAIHLVDLAD